MTKLETLLEVFARGEPPYSIKELTELFNIAYSKKQLAEDPFTSAPKTVSEITVRRLVESATQARLVWPLPRTKKGVLYHNKPYYQVMRDGSKTTGSKTTGAVTFPVAGSTITPTQFLEALVNGQLSSSSIIDDSVWDSIRITLARLVLSTDPCSEVETDLVQWRIDLESFRDTLIYTSRIINDVLSSELWNPKIRDLVKGNFNNGSAIEAKLKELEKRLRED